MFIRTKFGTINSTALSVSIYSLAECPVKQFGAPGLEYSLYFFVWFNRPDNAKVDDTLYSLMLFKAFKSSAVFKKKT
jgi:hypothetical protein